MHRRSLLALMASPALLAGCGAVPRDVKLDPDSKQALLAASVRLLTDQTGPSSISLLHWTSLTYHRIGTLGHLSDGLVSSRDGGIPIEGERFAKLHLEPREPGDYEFELVKVGGMSDRIKARPTFTLRPGRITYLGEILVWVEGMRYRLVPSDQRTRDLPLLFKQWPGLKPELVDVEILRIP